VSEELEVQIPDKMFFRIGELATLIGVEAHVLRYWESEFRIRPQRSKTGQRMYTRQDITRFLRIKSLLYKQGFTIAGARRAMTGPKQDASEAVATTDVEQIRTALRRVEQLRVKVLSLKKHTVTVWDEHLG
jgi:DNA-binding transcriptional MerR regulator